MGYVNLFFKKYYKFKIALRQAKIVCKCITLSTAKMTAPLVDCAVYDVSLAFSGIEYALHTLILLGSWYFLPTLSIWSDPNHPIYCYTQ